MDLQEIRKQLDDLDYQLVHLLEQRMELCGEVANYKIANQKPVFDHKRELEKIESVKNQVSSEFMKQSVEELFSQIMSLSRKLQYRRIMEHGAPEEGFVEVDRLFEETCKVVYQGVPGAYAYAAMRAFFGKEIENKNVPSWRDAVEEVKQGKADYAVLPIENSTSGSINEVWDLLMEYDNYVVAEVLLPVRHCLLGLPNATLDDIAVVYSHPQGLLQCSHFLEEHKEWKQIAKSNTAVAAKQVLEEQDITHAAIASREAAELYGLQVLKEGMNSQMNTTRFFVITNRKISRKEAQKICICFQVPHESGSLYRVLSHFIFNGLNMTKIESRPMEGKRWEYSFFAEFEGNLKEANVKNALRGIKEEVQVLKVLGNY